MIRRAIMILSVVAFCGGLACAAHNRPLAERILPTSDGVRIREWIYLSGGLKVKGLLFLPAGNEQRPAVVFCHDGISGISEEHRRSSIRLAKAGYVVFAPSYRGEDGSEGVVEVAKGEIDDVLNALPLVAALPQVDGDRIALVGASHGSLISLFAAARSSRVKALVLAYGVADIYRWWDHLEKTKQVGKDPVTLRTYGGGPEDRPESFEIRHGLSVADEIEVPVLILQGEKDAIVPPEQGRILKKELERHGVSVTLKTYPDALHGFLVYAPYLDDASAAEKKQTEDAWDETLDFLETHLGDGAGESASPAPSP
ncbi:MAG: S9 family peptidase [Armatimonadetes bacterium]|nr:S9 family peptidase [Armatimonadota bacterium]